MTVEINLSLLIVSNKIERLIKFHINLRGLFLFSKKLLVQNPQLRKKIIIFL